MNVRFLTLAAALTLSACSGGGGGGSDTTKDGGNTDTVDTQTDGGTTPTGETGTTGGGGDGFVPKYMTIAAQFAFDGNTNSLVDATIGGNAIPNAIFISFGTDAWLAANLDTSGQDPSLDAEFCQIVMPLTNSALANWALTDPTVYYGVDYDGGVNGALTNCGDADHPMTAYFTSDDILPGIINDYGGWGAGIGDPGEVFDSQTTTVLAANYVGARIQNADFVVPKDQNGNPVGTGSDHYYAFPADIDPTTFEILDDGSGNLVPIPVNQVWTGVSLHTGLYIISDFFYWSF